jgi:hypothetical protein
MNTYMLYVHFLYIATKNTDAQSIGFIKICVVIIA